MTHPVVTSTAAYVAWEKERVQLANRRETLAKQILAANAEREKAESAHTVEVHKAVRNGKPIPRRPEPIEYTHLDVAFGVQQRDEEVHRSRRQQALAQAARDGALDALVGRERARWERFAALAPEIETLVGEAQEDARTARILVGALDQEDGVSSHPSRSDRINSHPDLSTLLVAAAASATLLEPVSVQGPPVTAVLIDDDTDVSGEAGRRRAPALNAPRTPRVPSRGVEI